jgi:hypothetical protein
METNRSDFAQRYIQHIELSAPRSSHMRGGFDQNSETIMETLQITRQQAAVIGSEIVAFTNGVNSAQPQDLINGTLLAQLVANKMVAERPPFSEWYNAYFDALTNIGWFVQDQNFATYVESSENFEAHQAILKVAATVLGAAPSALLVVTNTLKASQAMDASSPWLTLFARENQSAETASFQISAVEQGSDRQPVVSLMAFGLQAHTGMTQVLFFKGRTSEVTLHHWSSRMSIDPDVVAAVRPMLKEKLASHVMDYVKAIPANL